MKVLQNIKSLFCSYTMKTVQFGLLQYWEGGDERHELQAGIFFPLSAVFPNIGS